MDNFHDVCTTHRAQLKECIEAQDAAKLTEAVQSCDRDQELIDQWKLEAQNELSADQRFKDFSNTITISLKKVNDEFAKVLKQLALSCKYLNIQLV